MFFWAVSEQDVPEVEDRLQLSPKCSEKPCTPSVNNPLYTLSWWAFCIQNQVHTLPKEPQRMLQSWSFPQTWTSCPALVLPHPWPAFWLATPAPSGKKWKNCFKFWVCLWVGTILMNKFVFILFFVTRCAFVLPTYEIHEAAALPQDKSQLAELVKRLFAKY